MRANIVPRVYPPALLSLGSNPYDTIRGLAATCSTDSIAAELKKQCLRALDEGTPKGIVVQALKRGVEELFEMARKYPDVASQIKFLPPHCFDEIMKAIMAHSG